MTKISAALFDFAGNSFLSAYDAHTRIDQPTNPVGGAMLALTGPCRVAEAGRLPVRGDLAHIRLAGRYFVPHYAVPMPHDVVALVSLRAAAKLESEEICALPKGDSFNVLDISGDWAWGQCGEDGPVGYVPLGNLQAP